ncbi:MAG: iron-sulfur cluster assembly protein [Vulcanimicrobiaceae bacterium]
MSLREQVIAALRTVRDPELPVSVYDLGLIYALETDSSGAVAILMTLTAPNCPTAGTLPGEVERAVRAIPGVADVCLELTFEPAWSKERVAPAVRLFLGLDDSSSSLVRLRL